MSIANTHCALLTGSNDGLGANGTLVRKLVAEAIATVGFVLTHQERTAGQFCAAFIAGEAFLVPRLVFEHHTIRHDDLNENELRRQNLKLSNCDSKSFESQLKCPFTSQHLTHRVANLLS